MNEQALLFIFASIVLILFSRLFRQRHPNVLAQQLLDKYLEQTFSKEEIGKIYERYIGYLYEREGYNVVYNGLIHGHDDMGRDLIVRSPHEVLIIQTKCWAKYKRIQEKQVYQTYGTTAHFKLTSLTMDRSIRAIMYTTSGYGGIALRAAEALGVECRTRALDMSYPMIKCSVSASGTRKYYLPFDSGYDKVRIDYRREEFFVKTVAEAVKRGFQRDLNECLRGKS